MLRRSWILALGIATLGTLCWSDGAVARLAANGSNLNGSNLNGKDLNGVNLNGHNLNGASVNGTSLNATTLRGVKLILPDGTELLVR